MLKCYCVVINFYLRVGMLRIVYFIKLLSTVYGTKEYDVCDNLLTMCKLA